MTETQTATPQLPDNGPQQIDTPPYPGTTKIDNGQAFDVAGKPLGAVDENGKPTAPAAAPSAFNFGFKPAAAPAGAAPAAASAANPSTFDFGFKPTPPPSKVSASGVVSTLPSATSIGPRPRSSVQEAYAALMTPGQKVDTEGFKNWLQDVQGDVRNGTSSTWVGSMLKFLGAKGTNYGVPQTVGDILAGPALGVPKAIEGAIDVGQAVHDTGADLATGSLTSLAVTHPKEVQKAIIGVNKVIGGTMQSFGPVGLIAAPEGEALPVIANATVIQNVAQATAKAMGASDDVSELVGNVAAITGATGTHALLHPLTERFGVAVNKSTAAEQEYVNRSRNLETARGQAAEMQKRAIDAANREVAAASHQAGVEGSEPTIGSRVQTDAARQAANEAAANVADAQEAFDRAAQVRAQAAVDVEKLHRQIVAKASKATAEAADKVRENAPKAMELMKKAIPAKGTDFYTPDESGVAPKYDIVRSHLEAAKEAGVPVDNIQDARNVAEDARQGIEDKVMHYTDKYDGEALTSEPADTKLEDSKSPKNIVTRKLQEMAAIDGNFEGAENYLNDFNVTDPTVGEAKETITKLNDHLRQMKKSSNNWDIYNQIETNPKFAAYYMLVDEMRDALFNVFESHDVEGIREARGETAALVDFRNMADAQIRANRGGAKVRGSGTQNRLRSLIGRLTGKAIKGASIAAGAEMGGVPGAVAGGAVGEMVGEPVENYIAPSDLTRDEHVGKSMKNKGTLRKPVEITGEGTEPVIPKEPIPPAPKDVGPEPMQLTPRENTDLHADLAAHYGITDLESTSYQELEQDLRDDITTKKNLGMEPSAKEQTLLNKVLKADAADRGIRAEAAKTAAQQAATPKTPEAEKAEKSLITAAEDRAENGPATEVNPHLASLGRGDESALVSHTVARKAHVPATEISGLGEGVTSQDAHIHEAVHLALDALNGEPTGIEIRSDKHPDMEKDAGAAAVFSAASFKGPDGKVIPEKLAPALDKWIMQKLGGPLSHEVFGGMTKEEAWEHSATRNDIRDARRLVREVYPDWSESQVKEYLDEQYEAGRKLLTQPHIADRIKANAAVREENLPDTLHWSRERVSNFQKDILEAHNEQGTDDAGPDRGGNREGGEGAAPTEPEGEKNAGAGKSGRGEEPRGGVGKSEAAEAEQSSVSKPEVPKERSTGEPEVDEAIRKGGGIPGGRMSMDENNHVRMFHDPETGTTLGFSPKEEVTPEAVKAKLAASRKAYGLNPEESQISQQDRAKDLAEKIGGRVVGSAAKEGPAKDIDLRIDGQYDKPGIQKKLEAEGLTYRGSSLVSPQDGMHRIVQAHQQGKETIPAKIWSGYSDVANVHPEVDGFGNDGDNSPEKEDFRGVHYSGVPAEGGVLRGNTRGVTNAGSEAARVALGAEPGVYAYREGARPEPQIATRANKYGIEGKKAIADISGAQKGLFSDAYTKAKDAALASGDNDTVAGHKGLNAAETALKNAGYDGYEHKEDYPGIVFLFGDQKTAPENAQLAAHEANGGSTFTPEGKNLAGENLHAVAPYPERSQIVDKLTPENLAAYKAKNADLLGDGQHAVGTWHDPESGKTYLDISKTIADRDEAIKAGQDANQKAIYNLKTGETIPTGGTGFHFGENAKEAGGASALNNLPRPAGTTHAMDLINALRKK